MKLINSKDKLQKTGIYKYKFGLSSAPYLYKYVLNKTTDVLTYNAKGKNETNKFKNK